MDIFKKLTDLYICKVGAFQLSHPVYDQWRQKWSSRTHSKLYAINSTMEWWSHACQGNCRNEVVLTRLGIGHTYLAHAC